MWIFEEHLKPIATNCNQSGCTRSLVVFYFEKHVTATSGLVAFGCGLVQLWSFSGHWPENAPTKAVVFICYTATSFVSKCYNDSSLFPILSSGISIRTSFSILRTQNRHLVSVPVYPN